MKTLMMKSGLVGLVLGVGFGFSATNPCISNVDSYQLRTLGRAEAHRITAVGSEVLAVTSNPTVKENSYSLRSLGRAEAHRILPANANESAAIADVGRIDRLRALGRGEGHSIGNTNCGEFSNSSPEVSQR